MKTGKRTFCAILAMLLCLGCGTAVACADYAGRTRANDLYNPGSPSRAEEQQQKLQQKWEQLSYKAYCSYEYMVLPDLRDMLTTEEVRYVQGTYGQGILATDGPAGEKLSVLPEGTRLTVHARHGAYSFCSTDYDYVCWVRSSLIVKQFNQELSAMRLWDYQARHGIS